MGVIVCQSCEKVIEHYENEKVSTLYGNCCEQCADEASLMNNEE
ncbi:MULTISPECIES: GapA-binding peptide SR1P [Alteribacter]|uniref:GapA-binding peptide SR1P n=1 Tax=Alteribacter keqinensis TaxID=2483800 RepID=A0A3M7TY22_9BACI|nr:MULTISPECIES: GapA-binding peptide SR1P [Alteribacter]MBM7095975.1 GapA-binding peptide SR1P [Alteribacter salitolerans]RNA69792.1 GapA-binding peptide SR1P [Alteribacter keqinensis]